MHTSTLLDQSTSQIRVVKRITGQNSSPLALPRAHKRTRRASRYAQNETKQNKAHWFHDRFDQLVLKIVNVQLLASASAFENRISDNAHICRRGDFALLCTYVSVFRVKVWIYPITRCSRNRESAQNRCNNWDERRERDLKCGDKEHLNKKNVYT